MSTVTSDRGGRGEATTSAELEPIAHPLAVAPAAPALPAGLLDDACRHVRRKALSTWLGCQLPSVLASFRTVDAHAATSAASARMRRRSRLERRKRPENPVARGRESQRPSARRGRP